ncbi:LysR family transcriptional regulator [Paenibacillus vini]|uniref:LysR family transcriptional regulator n=1 Tax=Paenibacillus vini TaxID=1476024 RepID=UPI0025B6405A|nr:LysR family transcriptional regulator [Paenibacillus vini]MDN4069679.1 LysR family transcriptional regulator [Paenibacillus vini]
MDMKNLKTFHLIVKYGSFIRAAEEMNYAQSTVTMQMQRLESELGVELLERGKTIVLTEAGRLFYEQSLQIMNRLEQLQSNLADIQSGEAGHVRLGVTEPTASYRLPRLLGRFQAMYPKIKLSVDIGSSLNMSEQIRKGELEFALCSAPDLTTGLYFEPLFYEKFVVLLPENHVLTNRSTLAPADFQGHRLLITSATCPYRRKLEMVLKEAGATPLDTMEIGGMTALQHYVEAGLGIALVPEIGLNPIPAGTVARQMEMPIDMSLGLLSRGPEAPLTLAVAKVYSFLQQELGSSGDR